MAENETDGRFEELRQRWEQDPSSRIFTQLAEEYRRRGETLEAVRVLEEGLKHHPGSIAAQVSLGRCRLEAGLVEPALAALEAVVRKDPTQLVAYRLLVDAYVQQGDAASARERLDIYSQLNAQDPEVEVLEERIRSLEAAPPSTATRPPEVVSGTREGGEAAPPPRATAPDAAVEPGEHGTAEATSSPRTRGPSGDGSLFRLPPASHSSPNLFALVPRPLRRWQDASADPASAGGEPSAPAPTQRSAGSLPTAAPREDTAPVQTPGLGAESAPEPAAGPSPPSSPLQRAGQPESLEGDARAELQHDAGEAPASALPPASAGDPDAATLRLDGGPLGQLGASEAPPSPAADEGPPEGRQPSPEMSEDDTLTLAELYRRQGHTEDAEQIFRRVLDSDPENPIAQSGLEQISAQRRGPADIASLLGDAAKPDAGVSEKKAAVLRNYLELLSDGSRDDVP